jgi:hypothetical protein
LWCFARTFSAVAGCRASGAPISSTAGGGPATSHSSGGDAHQPVFFEVALGTLHIDILVGRKLRADAVKHRETSFDVFAAPGFKSAFQIFAD